jgi:hypothetical protein
MIEETVKRRRPPESYRLFAAAQGGSTQDSTIMLEEGEQP